LRRVVRQMNRSKTKMLEDLEDMMWSEPQIVHNNKKKI
jgi:hypothetical protein